MIYVRIPQVPWYTKLWRLLKWPFQRIKCSWNKHIRWSYDYGMPTLTGMTWFDGNNSYCMMCGAKLKRPKMPKKPLTFPKHKRISLDQFYGDK